MDLLPEVKQRQLRSGDFTEVAANSDMEVESPSKSDAPQIQETRLTSLLVPLSANSTNVLGVDNSSGLLRSSNYETPTKVGHSFSGINPELGRFGSPSHERLFTNSDRWPKYQSNAGKSTRYDTATQGNYRIHSMNSSAVRGFSRTSPSHSQDNVQDKISTGDGRNMFLGYNLDDIDSPPVPRSNVNNSAEFNNDLRNLSSRKVQPLRDDRNWNVAPSEDPMDVSWR